jgi:hypothetical protein
MASHGYSYPQNFDVPSWDPIPRETFSDEFLSDPTILYAFFDAQLEATAHEFSAVRSWDSSLRVPYQYVEISTPSDPSSNSPPLSLDSPSSGNNLEATAHEFSAVRSWDSSLRVPYQYVEISTPSDPSSNSPPLSLDSPSSGNNYLPCGVPSEPKRKRDLVDGTSPNKRPKSANGRAHPTHTAMNRKIGACLTCQMRTNKHGCRPGPEANGPCEACWKKARANALGPLMCRRARFQDVKIIRLGPSIDLTNTLRWLKDMKATQVEWKKVTNLPAKKSRQRSHGCIDLQLSQGHSTNTLNLRVQEFDPLDSDQTSYPWFGDDGVKHAYQCPHYAIADIEHAADQVRHFIDSNVVQYLRNLLPATNNPSAKFVRMVFQNALGRVRESSLLANTIRFWVAGRLIEDDWSIKGDEKLGMELDPLPTSPYSQRIPVTPMMNFQIDNIVIYYYLVGMLGRIRKAMREKILPKKKEDWFDIYLATFILLHHADLTMKHDVDFAKKHHLPKRFSNAPLIEMITFGANSLLSFYQHEEGHFPLSALDWSEVERGHRFNDRQKSHLLEARRLIQQIDVPRKAGDDFFWTSQIYSRNWQPALVEVV